MPSRVDRIGCYGGYYLQSNLLEAFEHGFFTRQWHGQGPDVLAGYLSAGVSVHRPQQVHSAKVLPASEAASEPWPEADGLVGDAGGQSLGFAVPTALRCSWPIPAPAKSRPAMPVGAAWRAALFSRRSASWSSAVASDVTC